MPSISGIFKLDRPILIFSYGVKNNGLFGYEGEEE